MAAPISKKKTSKKSLPSYKEFLQSIRERHHRRRVLYNIIVALVLLGIVVAVIMA